MKIVMVIPSLNMGGGEKFAVDLANELAKGSNNQVTLCVISQISDDMFLRERIKKNINLISLNKGKGFDYKILFELKNFLEKNKFDIVHTHLRGMWYSSWSILTLPKTRYFYTIHNIVEKEISFYPYKIFLKFLFSYRKVTPVAITPEVLKGMQSFFGKYQNNMILNGVSPLKKSHKSKEIFQEISSYKKNPDTKVFINIANLGKRKNQKLLIESFKLLEHDAILIILGLLTNEPEYVQECQELIESMDNVYILGAKDNIADYLYYSDALCLSSTYEGLPLVILEAMSLGIPTISTSVGGIPDVIENGKNGYLTDSMEHKDYIELINTMIEDSQINNKDIYPIFEKNHSMEVCKRHYYELYQTKLVKK